MYDVLNFGLDSVLFAVEKVDVCVCVDVVLMSVDRAGVVAVLI